MIWYAAKGATIMVGVVAGIVGGVFGVVWLVTIAAEATAEWHWGFRVAAVAVFLWLIVFLIGLVSRSDR